MRAGEDWAGWPGFGGVVVRPGLRAGNYGGEKPIRQR